VEIDKSQILDLLRQQGKNDEAAQADQQLPDKVDPQQHSDLLSTFGIDPQELISKFAGGGLGGLLDG